MFFCKKLKNGLQLITAPISGTKSFTILVLFRAGSRHENLKNRGLAHFLEHIFFKGGKKYNSPKKVSAAIDSVGGEINAFTGKEYAGYFIKVAGEKKEIAFDVLSDILLSPKFSSEDIKREKNVILEELKMYQDTPIYQVGWDFERLLFGDNSLGWDQIGTQETITSFQKSDFEEFWNNFYFSKNAILVCTGDISQKESKQLTEKFFNFKPNNKKKSKFKKFSFDKNNFPVSIREKQTEQNHIVIGFPGKKFGDQDDITIRLLSIILGGNMSSRMFSEIREKLGLAYSIRTSTDHYSDVGVISTHAGVDLSRTSEAISAIKNQYYKMAKSGPNEKEVEMAKNFLKGKLTLQMEDSEELASFFGSQAILQSEDKIITLEKFFEKIEQISCQKIKNLAKELFNPEKIFLSAIGPLSDQKDEFAKIIRNQ